MNLRYWLTMWEGHYDTLLDGRVSGYEGRHSLNAWELDEILSWVAARSCQSLPILEGAIANDQVVEYTSRALGSGDDLGALLILKELSIGLTGASGVLAAIRPDTFTILQSLSLEVLRDEGHLSPLTDIALEVGSWLPYLRVTRKMARDAGLSLRTVDRALNEAGKSHRPR